jgi:hypothetical protein
VIKSSIVYRDARQPVYALDLDPLAFVHSVLIWTVIPRNVKKRVVVPVQAIPAQSEDDASFFFTGDKLGGVTTVGRTALQIELNVAIDAIVPSSAFVHPALL